MNKQQLASKIWQTANEMRSKIEANDYKDYILGFIFYKFLSEKELKFLYSQGSNKEELKEKLPDGWKYEEHNGRIHIKDPNGRMRLRIDPADKMTPYQHMHLYDNKGNLLDINGNPVPSKSPDGHIFYQP